MTFVDDSSRSVITVLPNSERQFVEFRVQNLIRKQIKSRDKPMLASINRVTLGKKQNKKVRLTTLMLSCNSHTCAC